MSTRHHRGLKSTADDPDSFARPQFIVQDPRVGGKKHATLMEAITNGKPVYFYEPSQLPTSHVQVENNFV